MLYSQVITTFVLLKNTKKNDMQNFKLITKPNGKIYGTIKIALNYLKITSIEGVFTCFDESQMNEVICNLEKNGLNFNSITEKEYLTFTKGF